jgi:hypothetical protein
MRRLACGAAEVFMAWLIQFCGRNVVQTWPLIKAGFGAAETPFPGSRSPVSISKSSDISAP